MPDRFEEQVPNFLRNLKLREWIRVSERGTFAVFVLLAFIIWVFGALSKNYTLEIPVNIVYENIPEDMIATAPLAEKLFVTVTGEGRSLIRKRSDAQKNAVVLDLSKGASNKRIAVQSLIPQFIEQFSGMNISGVQPDTLIYQFTRRTEKKVPVKVNHELSFVKQFSLDVASASPDSVLLNGPANIIDELSEWPTETVKYADLSGSKTGTIGLSAPQTYGMVIEPAEVEYDVKVNEYTEKVVEVPIRAINLPADKKVILYPNKAKITYQVSVSKYNLIDGSFFEVVADFEGRIPKVENEIPVIVQSKPLDAKNVRVNPKFVDIIIYK